jgi:hypothetical protein
VPTVIVMSSPAPPTAAPVETTNSPVDPLPDVPDVKANAPLMPALPA